ncbi:MAG: SRPBCC domain-containing protein [Cyclobacteriaceae bacterium]
MADFKKYFIIDATPEELYAALTFKPTIELWTGSPATFVPVVGSEFALWDESILGKNLDFIPHKLIKQQWYFGDEPEESIVTLKLHEHKKGTSLEVIQTNIPDEAYDDIVDGWQNYYIRSLVEFYSE